MRLPIFALSLSVAATALVAAPSPADACGGFFCSQSAPVDQTGERILFAQIDDATVEAHVQILYTGPSEAFSWVLPTPTEPDISLGSDWLFQQLSILTGPQIGWSYQTEGTCRPDPPRPDPSWDGGFWDAGTSADTASDSSDPSPPGVEVVAIEQVGPFDTAILRADAIAPMLEWLNANGYDVPAETGDLLELYLGGDTHFVAFKLTKDADAGDLQPVVLRYGAEAPMIPIQLTAVAAQPDMPIYTWVLADAPALPANYANAEVNAFRRAYEGVSSIPLYAEALDELDEHAFVTEFRGDASVMGDAVFAEWMYPEAELRAATDPLQYYWILRDRSGTLASDPAFLGFLNSCIPFPEELAATGVTIRDFYNCPDCYPEYLPDVIDAEACTDRFFERIIEPRQHAQSLIDALPSLTRMTTVLDPDEMTLDPGFCYRTDAAPVARAIPMTDTTVCDPRVYTWEAPHRIEHGDDAISVLPDQWVGDIVRPLPALRSAWAGGCGDAPEVLVDNADAWAEAAADTAAALDAFLAALPDVPDSPDGGLGTGDDATGDDATGDDATGDGSAGDAGSDRIRRDEGGCSTTANGPANAAWALLVLLALVPPTAARRRRGLGRGQARA